MLVRLDSCGMLEAVDGSPHTLEEVRPDAPEAKQVWLCPKHNMHAVWTPADHLSPLARM